jgi:hypothetical protein
MWSALLVMTLSANAQNATHQAMPASEQAAARAVALETYQGAWDVDQQRSAAMLWNELRLERPSNTEAQYNYFRAARNESLATNNGRLPATDKAELKNVAETLKQVAPGSFESCMANYQMGHPARSAFTELGKAYQKDPDRTELIGPMLGRAILDNDKPALERWGKAMRTRGGLSPGLNDVAVDLLQSVDANGVVFTNGDMDTYPAVAVQQVDKQRTDVLVVDQRLLEDAGYRQQVWASADASGTAPGPGPEYARTLSTSTSRPVFLALSLDPSWFSALNGQLYASGLAFRISASPVENIPALEQRWSLMRKSANAGPLSRNYLLPGTVLLQHYRDLEDEANGARQEQELRRFSKLIGAEQDLYKAGILKH